MRGTARKEERGGKVERKEEERCGKGRKGEESRGEERV